MRVRAGLRLQILAALLLVTVGGIISVGFISVWRTRQILAAERLERIATLTDLGGQLMARALAAGAGPLGESIGRAAPDIQRATGATELAVFDERGAVLWPRAAASLPTDEQGRAGASAGMKAFVRQIDRATPGRVALYAAVPGGGARPLVLRAVYDVDAAVDATLSRAQRSVILLGVLDGLVLLAAAAWMLRSAVVRPVRELERAAGRVAAGDLAARVEVRGPGELGRLADAFEHMTGSLRESRETLIRSEKLASVGRLAAGVAHEVGNPLAAILGYVETLLSDTPERPIDPALRADILRRVRGETERIHRIIQELLDYSRPAADADEPVELRRVCDAALSLVKAQSRFKGLTVEIAVPEDLPAVRGSASRLTQVVLNLLLNAGDATDGQGRVRLAARRDGARVRLTVADDGPGVPEELRAKIFDPFFTTKDVGKGTGLGLSVSHAIAESMGGTIRLLPTPAGERGARFEVDLPVA